MAYLALEGLAKHYGRTVAVADVTLHVEKGEAVALLGPSGCGKTTTLRMVAGLIDPSAGSIAVAGEALNGVPAHRRNMGYVFQSYALFPHMSVAENVRFGLVERGISRDERDRRTREALAMVRLNGLEARKPRELSGGQQQRVALARALVIEPSVLLLDESLSNLDAKLRDTMRHEIREIQRKLGITTLFVTHDQVEALTMCDRIAVMDQGRIAQIGTAREIYEKPATRFVADFVGRSNVLPAEVGPEGRLTLWGAPIPARATGEGPWDVFLRPQRLRLAARDEATGPETGRLDGIVARSVFVGDRIEVLVDCAGGRLTVEISSGSQVPADGTAIFVLWKAEDTLLFRREGA